MIGEKLNDFLELASSDHEIVSLTQLIHGAEALVILFTPFCFGEINDNTMENLIVQVNERIEEFNQQDLRVICIAR
jgi:hypothetical protein